MPACQDGQASEPWAATEVAIERERMTWHNCDGKIGKLLRYASRPASHIGNSEPTWFVWLANRPLMIKYCPVCGEELSEMEETAWLKSLSQNEPGV